MGGRVASGNRDRLAVVLYEAGSGWGVRVGDAQAAGEDVYLEADESVVTLVTHQRLLLIIRLGLQGVSAMHLLSQILEKIFRLAANVSVRHFNT